MDSLSVANGDFTLELFKNLNQSSQGNNVFYSPWSISSALAMVYMGARNSTADQMAKVLHFNATKDFGSSSQKPGVGQDETPHSEFQELISEINQPRSTYVLKTANRLYGEKTFSFIGLRSTEAGVISIYIRSRIVHETQTVEEYLQLAKKYYHAEPQAVDFLNSSEQVRGQINAWVETQTDSKIKNLLPKGAVDSQTALVLVNAIYFKGKWKTQFQKKNTTEKPFRLSKTKSKPVQMMFLKDKFPAFYVDTLRVYILELPYINNELSMLILLPEDITDESTGLELLEKELTYERLSIWTSPEMMEKTEMELHLPRIKLEESYDLKSTLRTQSKMASE
ncbi:heterochromatin-associated protein MENT-like isoform X3 [Rhineura floridana]|uniref:heterochromatin-associated protein MENT-like isoform X3 n=1 Tax=Rhineura floridana TaxID=261503 RepID=UPI002AC88F04|nr:heterochromatin-associated protein MENT-like isoform X3 [Rhineura floridana]